MPHWVFSPGTGAQSGWDGVGDLTVLAGCISSWEQTSRLNFCPLLQRHFCVFAMSFPGQEALLAVYSTILAQHLDLQRMPLAVQKLQPQLVAAALGEPLPRWGVGRRHTPASAPHPPAPGNPTTSQLASALGAPRRTSTSRHWANETSVPPFLLFAFKTQHHVPRNCQTK